MRNNFKYFVISLIVASLTFLSVKIFIDLDRKSVANHRIEHLPHKTKFTWLNKFVDFHKSNLILIFYHPDCNHCQNLANQLIINKNKFSNTEFWFISFAKSNEINEFKKFYLNDSLNYNFGMIPVDKIDKIFFNNSIPQVYVYDENRNLQIKYLGEPDIDQLLTKLK